MAQTTLGYHYATGSDETDIGVTGQLAADVDASPGVSSLTQSQIDELTAGLKRAGRLLWNATAGVLQRSDGSTFATVPTLTNAAPADVTVTGSAVLGAATTAARADHAHKLPAHDHSTSAQGGAIPQASVTGLTAALAARPVAAAGNAHVSGGSVAITFPAGRFSAAPMVVATVADTGITAEIRATSVTATGATLKAVVPGTATPVSAYANWVAVSL